MKITWTKDKEAVGKKEIVAEAKRIISDWGLKMPEAAVIAFDFGLGNFYLTGEVEFWIANETSDGYCGKFLFLFSSQTCPKHHHRKKHETFFIIKGRVSMEANGKRFELTKGNYYAMAPGVDHTFTAMEKPALIIEVSKPCEPGDSIFEDKQIGRI